MKQNKELSKKIEEVVTSLKPKLSEVSLAVIDLNKSKPEIAGYNLDKFIYPASIYKVFVGAEALRQVETGTLSLEDNAEVVAHNAIDKKKPKFFSGEIHRDNRPLLKSGERASLDYLLDLMLTRSDNTAANVLIDVVGRENINKNIIEPNSWQGSEVTRKFLARSEEDADYKEARGAVSNARVLAEFFYKVETDQLVSLWVSKKLKGYLMKWCKDSQSGLSIPEFQKYYRKGGWWEVNGYVENFREALRLSHEKGYAITRYSGDVGVVTSDNSHYVIAVLTITKTKWPWIKFPMKKLSRRIYELMNS